MSSKYNVVEITFINENGVRITCNLETGMVTPSTLTPDIKNSEMLRTGIFIGAGTAGLEMLWDEILE